MDAERSMKPRDPIHCLSIIGYWTHPGEPPERSRGRPDPRDVVGEWTADERRDVLTHLRRGKVFRSFLGLSACRICTTTLGSRELTDGVWAWAEGLGHYVEAHATRLPEAFVSEARHSHPEVPAWVASLEPDLWMEGGDSVMPVDSTKERSWIVDECAWLDWAATNTPARPAGDALTLDEARAVCRRLSHPAWSCEVDDAGGRWVVRIGDDTGRTRIYLQKCSAAALERRLLSLRMPDPNGILGPERSEAIAAEYDGPWGAARVVGVHPQAWLVWVKGPGSDWPTEADIEKAVKREPELGWATFYPAGGKSFMTRPADEPAWRWLLTCEREDGERKLGLEPRGLARWWLGIRMRFLRS